MKITSGRDVSMVFPTISNFVRAEAEGGLSDTIGADAHPISLWGVFFFFFGVLLFSPSSNIFHKEIL